MSDIKNVKFNKKRNIKKISVSLDKEINELMEKEQVNKSKLVNFLIEKFFVEGGNIKKFIKK